MHWVGCTGRSPRRCDDAPQPWAAGKDKTRLPGPRARCFTDDDGFLPDGDGRGVAALTHDTEVARFAGQVLTSRQLADRYGVTDVDGSRPDCWGYIAEYGMWEQSGKHVERFR